MTTLFLASPGGAPDDIVPIWKAARDVGARITIHVGVGEFGRNALLEKIHAIEPLKSDTTYIHCCTLNDTEWKLIKDTGGTVSIAGYVETLMGHGNPPVQKAIDTGIRPVAQRRRRDLGAERLLQPDAHGVLAAEERGLGEAARPATRTRRSS